MKKLFWIAAALPLMLVSCGDDDKNIDEEPEIIDETITVSPATAEVKCGETVQLQASCEVTRWATYDTKIATVDSIGKVLGMHVGTTTIEATNQYGNTSSSEITVLAANNNFTAPLTSWNSSKSAIEAAMATWANITLSTNDAEALTYTTNGTFPMYAYGFNNDALLSSILAVSTDQDTELDLMGWIEERYWYFGEQDHDFLYYDAQSEANATMLIVYAFDTDLNAVTVTFTPLSNTKAEIPVASASKAAYNSLRKTLNK